MGCTEFFEELDSIDFYSILHNDENRGADGISLRERFFDECDADTPDYPCTILEMLIALSERMDFMLYTPARGDENCERWFWLFIKNLNLEVYDCNDPEIDEKKIFNRNAIQRFLDRQYDSTGQGGLFPLNNPKSDQRGIEVWYQLNYYVEENYEI